jgi:hypothetical protein
VCCGSSVVGALCAASVAAAVSRDARAGGGNPLYMCNRLNSSGGVSADNPAPIASIRAITRGDGTYLPLSI